MKNRLLNLSLAIIMVLNIIMPTGVALAADSTGALKTGNFNGKIIIKNKRSVNRHDYGGNRFLIDDFTSERTRLEFELSPKKPGDNLENLMDSIKSLDLIRTTPGPDQFKVIRIENGKIMNIEPEEPTDPEGEDGDGEDEKPDVKPGFPLPPTKPEIIEAKMDDIFRRIEGIKLNEVTEDRVRDAINIILRDEKDDFDIVVKLESGKDYRVTISNKKDPDISDERIVAIGETNYPNNFTTYESPSKSSVEAAIDQLKVTTITEENRDEKRNKAIKIYKDIEIVEGAGDTIEPAKKTDLDNMRDKILNLDDGVITRKSTNLNTLVTKDQTDGSIKITDNNIDEAMDILKDIQSINKKSKEIEITHPDVEDIGGLDSEFGNIKVSIKSYYKEVINGKISVIGDIDDIDLSNKEIKKEVFDEIEKIMEDLEEADNEFDSTGNEGKLRETYQKLKDKFSRLGKLDSIISDIKDLKDIMDKDKAVSKDHLERIISDLESKIGALNTDDITTIDNSLGYDAEEFIGKCRLDIDAIDKINTDIDWLYDEEIKEDNIGAIKVRLKDIDDEILELGKVFKRFIDPANKLSDIRNRITELEIAIVQDLVDDLEEYAEDNPLTEDNLSEYKDKIKEIEDKFKKLHPIHQNRIDREIVDELIDRIKDFEITIAPNFKIEKDKIVITMDDKARKKLSHNADNTTCGSYDEFPTAAGDYKIRINYKDGKSEDLPNIKIRIGEDEYLDEKDLKIRAKPGVDRNTIFPQPGSVSFNPEQLYKTFTNEDGTEEKGYYISVGFNSLGGLDLVPDPNIAGLEVTIVGESINIVDPVKSIRFDKEKSMVYIPLSSKPKDGAGYTIKIPGNGLVEYPEYRIGDVGIDLRNNMFKNRCFSWGFSTDTPPEGQRLYEGSVVENYDVNYPIVIDAHNITRDTKVFFKSTTGKTYSPDKLRFALNEDELGSGRIYVYLPRGRSRLPVGQYDIILKNAEDYIGEMKHGVLSVVAEGWEVPNEDYWTREDTYYGDVRAQRKNSSDILELRRSDRNAGRLEIDLDEIMGVDTWSRSIQYPGNYRDRINTLALKSVWANIEIANLRFSYGDGGYDLKLRAGRASPIVSENLKQQLNEYQIKSDFIEVEGENFGFNSVIVDIPYKNSEGNNLKMMMYDEIGRRLIEIQSTTDKVSKRVIGTAGGPGIFVIVE